ncbi:hypothetical protein [Curtobacterium sp. VKM Ac-1395]|uniref:hypothetical protein n=1 Tax=Curtobacterium sp. VKM Ac-1395 TaxID=2783815 RepID=UPI00188B1728|nr:hypothetical protein [Curtobacterium sp. VKM Ac-1395]MBF4592011.1 hypothetical protein [Curtobacterium sp. VKM Ac-1395]
MTSTSTSTTTYTRTQTATHLADVLMSTVAEILIILGIDTTRYFNQLATDQRAIQAWITEGSLKALNVECVSPAGDLIAKFEFTVSYAPANAGATAFTTTQKQAARYTAKVAAMPPGTTYRLVCTFNSARTPQPGWDPATLASTAHLSGRTIGTLASAPHASTSTRIYT